MDQRTRGSFKEAAMFLLVLKGIFLVFGALFTMYVLTSQIARQYIEREDGAGWFLATVLLMAMLMVVFWPIQRLLRKEPAWWARGWGRLLVFALLGVGFLLVGWFL
jgi:hypothetical protein